MSSPPNKSTPRKRIAIVGAGPGGLSALIALSQAGFDVRLFERQPEIIVGSWCGKRFRPEKGAAREGFCEVPAVRTGWLREVKSPLILQPGPAALTDGVDLPAQVAIGAEYSFSRIFFARVGKKFYNDDRSTGSSAKYGLSGAVSHCAMTARRSRPRGRGRTSRPEPAGG